MAKDDTEQTDQLVGEIEQTVATLKGEAENVRITRDPASLQEIADQLEYRAECLDSALEEWYGDTGDDR